MRTKRTKRGTCKHRRQRGTTRLQGQDKKDENGDIRLWYRATCHKCGKRFRFIAWILASCPFTVSRN